MRNNTNYYLDSCDFKPDKKIRNYAYMAYEIALTSKIKKGKHCAIILDNNSNILEICVNKYVSNKKSIHAEIGVINTYITKNNKNPINCWIMIIRGNMLGDINLSKPCLDCYKYIKNYKFNKIVWSTGYMNFEVNYLN